jgi:phosphate transport system ATP-binding protein
VAVVEMSPPTPPPIRRIVLDREPTVLAPGANGAPAAVGVAQRPAPATSAARRGTRAQADRKLGQQVSERMRIESVWLAYGEKWVVRDVTLPVRRGEVLALIGASGSGKTTLLRSLNRLTEITAGASRAGRITLDGEEVGQLEVTDLRRRVSMVFQQPNPFPMSIFENVAYALREERRTAGGRASRGRTAQAGGSPGAPQPGPGAVTGSPNARPRIARGRRGRAQLMGAVTDALRRAGLYEEVADDLDRPALRLSGGQQQRLCIARALAAQPEVLLLDEPCSALDPISTAIIEELIVGLRETVAIVIVTHNLQQAFRVADHVAFMHLGELVEYGSSEQVFDHPTRQRTRDYIGGAFG